MKWGNPTNDYDSVRVRSDRTITQVRNGNPRPLMREFIGSRVDDFVVKGAFSFNKKPHVSMNPRHLPETEAVENRHLCWHIANRLGQSAQSVYFDEFTGRSPVPSAGDLPFRKSESRSNTIIRSRLLKAASG